LLQSALAEIRERHPSYFAYRTLDVPSFEALAREYGKHPLLAAYADGALVEAVRAGLEYFADHDVPVRRDCNRTDQISSLLIRSALDAYAASRGQIPLQAMPARHLTTADVLCGRYSLERTGRNVCYVLAKGRGNPLVVISAIGLPLNLWLRLLDDRDLDRRCLIVQGHDGLLVEGGMPQPSSLWRDAEDIREVLLTECSSSVDILAWCSGARTAVEIARTMPEQVASLTLVAPTFHGATEVAKYASPFEDTLPNVRNMLQQDPQRGQLFLQSIVQPAPSLDLSALKYDTEKCVRAVLGLPPQNFVRELALPLATPGDFENYMQRATVDKPYNVGSALAEIRCPITLITGTHDTVTNTHAARDLLSRYARKVTHVTVLGAGHHIHLLQYGYFKYVLNCALAGIGPAGTLRLQVDQLAHNAEP
jgi:pimeloyl-ACP methyl ester carboxylesterase